MTREVREDSTMERKVVKTAHFRLLEPNQSKEKKLNHIYERYNEVLEEAIDMRCISMSEVNQIATKYDDLSGYVKDAMKTQEPAILNENREYNPRISGRGINVDRNENRWFVRIPHYKDYNMWLPVSGGDRDEALLEKVLSGEGKVCRTILEKKKKGWYVTIPIEYIEETQEVRNCSLVGIFAGGPSVMCAASKSPRKVDVFSDGASELNRIRSEFFHRIDTGRRVDRRAYQRRKREVFHRMAKNAVRVVPSDSFVVVQDLDFIQWPRMGWEFYSGWAVRELQEILEEKLIDSGIPVARVKPRIYKEGCHSCGCSGERCRRQFRCTNDNCWVSEYNYDANAALDLCRVAQSERGSLEMQNQRQ